MKKSYFIILLLAWLLPTAAHAYTLDPPSGSTMKSIKQVDLFFDFMIDKIDTSKVYITDNATQAKTPCTGFTMNYSSQYYMMGGTLNFSPITGAGTYTLTIEAGAMKPWFDTNPSNELIEATYTVDPNAPEETVFTRYTLSPSGEKPVAQISKIALQFPKISYSDNVVDNPEQWKKITLSNGSLTYHCVELNGYYGNWNMLFNTDPAATEGITIKESGEYTLSIPAGIVNNGANTDSDEDLVESPAISATYTVDSNIEFPYTTYPEAGATKPLPSIGDISLQFTMGGDASSVTLDQAIPGAEIAVSINGTPVARVENLSAGAGYAVNAYGVNLEIKISKSLITEPSLITVTAPRGAFTVDGIASPSINYSVTYNPPKTFTYTFSPSTSRPVKPFKELTVTFTNASTIAKQYYCYADDATLWPVGGSGMIRSTSIEISPEGVVPPTMTVTFDAELADGIYEFSLPKGDLMLDGEDSPAINAHFTIDANAPEFIGQEPPYTNSFDTAGSLDGFTIINSNGDKKPSDDSDETWTWIESEYDDAAVQEIGVGGDSKDDWLITPPLKLDAGKTYKVSLHARPFAFWNESFEVKCGNDPSAGGMTLEVIPEVYMKDALAENDFSGYVTVAETGDWYIGIHATTEEGGWTLLIDDLSISAPLADEAPAAVGNLSATTDPANHRKAIISFTAPDKSVGGDELKSIEKIAISRNGEEIKSFENPEPGKEITYTDVLSEAGEYTYSVIPFAGGHEGVIASVKSFIGTPKASFPTNVKVKETENNGEVTITWDAPEKDVNGNPIDADQITYYVEKIQDINGERVQTLLKRYVKGTSLTVKITEPDAKQAFYSFGVYAETDGGISFGSETRLIPLGKAYTLPWNESFDLNTISLIAVAPMSGNSNWGIYGEAEGRVPAADGDDSYAGAEGESDGDSAILYTGKIDLKNAEKPEMSFYVYNFGPQEGAAYSNELDIMVNTGDEFKSVRKIVIGKECGSDTPGWYQQKVDLSDFKGKEIQLGLLSTIRNHTHVFADAIEVKDNGLSVGTIDCGSSVTTYGNTIVINNPAGLHTTVHTLDGHTIFSGNDNEIKVECSRGIHIVRIGEATLKIFVK